MRRPTARSERASADTPRTRHDRRADHALDASARAPSGRLAPQRALLHRALLLLALLAASLAPAACGDASADDGTRAAPNTAAESQAPPSPGAAVEDRAADVATVATVVVIGDSISAGYHLDEREAFPALLAERLADDDMPVRMINAGVSGDTSAGGLRRLDWLLEQRPDVLVVELGGNDGLRGQPVEQIEANLRGILERARAAGAEPLLLGMALPPSYGPTYTAGFVDLYSRLADDLDVAFVPSFMQDVGGRSEFNLDDGLHPNAAGHEKLAERVYPALRRLVAEVAGLD